jgi:predicted CoA-binding protein
MGMDCCKRTFPSEERKMLIDEKKLAAQLREVKTIAVVGAVDKPSRPVDRVAREMMAMGFTVVRYSK